MQWVDEDEQNAVPEDDYMNNFGGGGAGGMGEDGGFGGIDFSKLGAGAGGAGMPGMEGLDADAECGADDSVRPSQTIMILTTGSNKPLG